MGDFNLGEVVNLKTGLEVISSNSSVVSELRDIELVGGAWELEPDHFADVSQVYLGQGDTLINSMLWHWENWIFLQLKH